jgi:competence ComEA-like helix-hairpin-helix protein
VARTRRARRRLRELGDLERAKQRELGVLVLEMYRGDRFDELAIRDAAAALAELQRERRSLREELGEPSEPVSTAGREAATLPPGEAAAPDPAEGGAGEESSEIEGQPRAEQLNQLTSELEGAEQRVRRAAEDARREAEEHASDEIRALEEDLEREQRRAAEALEALRAQLEQSTQEAAKAEEERRRHDAEARSAAAEWLRGQAEAMRREAVRQVREELAERGAAPGDAELTARIEAAERALAEMTQRSNEANARAQQAEERARAELESARLEIEERFAAELRSREEEIAREREEKTRALAAAEERLAEIERQALAVSAELDAKVEAARRAGEEAGRARAVAELSGSEATAAAKFAPAEPARAAGGDRLNVNRASFEQLRGLGMSITQANRVIAYRDRFGGYESVEDLDQVPGFPRAFLAEVKAKVEV